MATKYMMVRKTKSGKWRPCWLDDDSGRNVEGGATTDKFNAERQRRAMAKTYPQHTYALLELPED